MAVRKRKRSRILTRGILTAAVLPLLYLGAALVGSFIPTNSRWSETTEGVTIYIANNGIHADLVLPANALGLDWSPLVPKSDFRNAASDARYVAFGAGEKRVYLETPRWRDVTIPTIWAALTGGERVMHVEWISDPGYAEREIRLRPEEYRRLWAAIRAEFELNRNGLPQKIEHPGYGPGDAFYKGIGKASALNTCNTWTADRLRIAGIRASLWAPFAQGVTWRYRPITYKI